MGITKTANFTNRQNALAKLMKALAHPARIGIIEHILKTDECSCNDLVDVLGLAQATISQHLRELKDAGLISGKIEGNSVYYCIHEETWTLYKEQFNSFFVKVELKDQCY